MVFTDMTDTQYSELTGLRASWLKTLHGATPAHLHFKIQNPDDDSDALRIGRALHTRVLQPHRWDADWAVAPECDRRTTVGKATWSAFDTECKALGKGVLTAGDAAAINGIVNSIDTTTASMVLGMCEHREIVCTGEIGGVACKARIDACSASGMMVDIKSCLSASERAFTRSIVDYGYLLQMAFYRRLMRQCGMEHGPTVLIACEKSRPHAVALYALRDEDIDRMDGVIDTLVQLYAQCVESNTWPSYPRTVRELAMPEWAFKEVSQ